MSGRMEILNILEGMLGVQIDQNLLLKNIMQEAPHNPVLERLQNDFWKNQKRLEELLEKIKRENVLD